MTTVAAVLTRGTQELAAITDVPKLEADILLAYQLNISREQLYTYPEKKLSWSQQKKFWQFIKRRCQQEPVAYLIGQREFWSLDLKVNPSVLIPRPETERIVELVIQQISESVATIADLGTGSGAIALAIAHEKPKWKIHATDISLDAIEIAEGNAERLGKSNIQFHTGSWCQALPNLQFNAIVSNPPYLAEDELTPYLRFEPANALISKEEGFQALAMIIEQSGKFLLPGGLLILEHGASQAKKITRKFAIAGYTDIYTYHDLAGLERVTIGKAPI